MIRIEEVTKKFARIYHTVDDIKNLHIRVRLIDESYQDEEHVALFKWQQKRFSHQERERYQHEENCLTDLDKAYHQQIAKESRRRASGDINRSMIFSYTSRDVSQTARLKDDPSQRRSRRRPGKPDEGDKQNELAEFLEKMSLLHKDEGEEDVEDDKTKERRETFDYFKFLGKNMETPVIESNLMGDSSSETFYIMADFGEDYNSTWIPSEYILCTIEYHPKTKTLRISPDFTTFDAHAIKVTSDETKTYRYFLENASLDDTPGKSRGANKEQLVLNQMNTSIRNAINLRRAECPPGGSYVHVILEILSGEDFENDHVFVRYSLALNGWKMKKFDDEKDETSGVTITSKRTRNRLHFGYPVEWHLLGDDYMESNPVVTFELISKDTWSRFRSEGQTRLHLPLGLPGRRVYALRCARITSPGVVNELRRFFVGDCANYKTQQPEKSDVNNMATCTTSTGVLAVAVNVLHLRGKDESGATFENLRETRLRDKLRDPQLTKTVEEAVGAFKRASKAMLEARHAAVN